MLATVIVICLAIIIIIMIIIVKAVLTVKESDRCSAGRCHGNLTKYLEVAWTLHPEVGCPTASGRLASSRIYPHKQDFCFFLSNLNLIKKNRAHRFIFLISFVRNQERSALPIWSETWSQARSFLSLHGTLFFRYIYQQEMGY